ncbi:MAG: M67 family metallopeptidase [Phycisphaerales bacterium]|nr:M67 family metallopeptidase [Phycisphaerales bacterium]
MNGQPRAKPREGFPPGRSTLHLDTMPKEAASPAAENRRAMLVKLEQTDMNIMRDHARACHPEECCGVVLGLLARDAIQITDVLCAQNIAEGDRRRRYQIEWSVLFQAYRQARGSGHRVVGFFHSHPDGTRSPSATDQAEALPDHLYLILPVDDAVAGDPSSWLARGGTFDPCPMLVQGGPVAR